MMAEGQGATSFSLVFSDPNTKAGFAITGLNPNLSKDLLIGGLQQMKPQSPAMRPGG